MNLNSVKSILTLRYDYTQTPILPKLSWKDLENKENFTSEEILHQSISNIKKQIPDDFSKPISISLSGGMDSSLALCMLKQSFPDNQIDAISIKFSDSHDETETASKIAKKIGVDHHIIKIDNFLEKLPDAISITKLPFWDIHWLYVVEKAKNFSNYLVSGDGGDELFGGYTFHFWFFVILNFYHKLHLILHQKTRFRHIYHVMKGIMFQNKKKFLKKRLNSLGKKSMIT